MNQYLSRLYNSSPYDGLEESKWPSDLHGWNDHAEMFSSLARDAELIVEVGAWKGRSTVALANRCPKAVVLSIDTWLGAKEMWTNKRDPERYGALRLKNGYPQLFYEFASNMIRAGIQDRVVPMPMTASIGLSILREWAIRPDLIFIDASHDYPDVKQDIMSSLELRPRIICGDDYTPGWFGVQKAVDECLTFGSGVTKFGPNGFWWREFSP